MATMLHQPRLLQLAMAVLQVTSVQLQLTSGPSRSTPIAGTVLPGRARETVQHANVSLATRVGWI